MGAQRVRRERELKKAKTELATAEIEAKLLPAIEGWDEHKLAGVIAGGDLRGQFDMVHADEEFVRAAAQSALEKKTSEEALELAKEANLIAARANSIAKCGIRSV